MRSAETLRNDAMARGMAASVAGSSVKPSCAAWRTPRIGRRPSSVKRRTGSPTVRTSLRREIDLPGEGIDEGVGVGIVGDGVHGEVTPGEILLEGRAEGHGRRTPAVEVGALPAKGRHLDVARGAGRAGQHGDRPMLQTGRDGVAAAEDPQGLLGMRAGGDVEIARGAAEQEVANAAADQVGGVAGLAQAAAHGEHVVRDSLASIGCASRPP